MTTQVDMTQPLVQAGSAIGQGFQQGGNTLGQGFQQANITLTNNTYLGRLLANLVPLSIGGGIGAIIMILLLIILKHIFKIKLI